MKTNFRQKLKTRLDKRKKPPDWQQKKIDIAEDLSKALSILVEQNNAIILWLERIEKNTAGKKNVEEKLVL